MSVQLQAKEYLTLGELEKRWACSTNDLKRLIVHGHLIPSFVINHVAKKVRFSLQADCSPPYWLPIVIETEMKLDEGWDAPPSHLHDTEGMYYLLHPEVEAALDCKFFYFSNDRNHQKGPEDSNICYMFSLTGKHELSLGITLDTLFKRGMITLAEIERYETEHALSNGHVSVPYDGGLSTTAKRNQRWEVIKPKRKQGYGDAVYRFLVAEHQAGKDRPSARDVVNAWRSDQPKEIEKILEDSVDYYDAKGNTKPADLKALTATISRMTRLIPE